MIAFSRVASQRPDSHATAPSVPPGTVAALALDFDAAPWEWCAVYVDGADVVSLPGTLGRVAADFAHHLPRLAAVEGFVSASLRRRVVVH